MWDRAKPGIIAVNAAGRRFVDESVSYHRFTRAVSASHASVPTIPAWLVTDARALASYGLGMIHPHTPRPFLKRHMATGYLHSGRTLHLRGQAVGLGVRKWRRDREVAPGRMGLGGEPRPGRRAGRGARAVFPVRSSSWLRGSATSTRSWAQVRSVVSSCQDRSVRADGSPRCE
ncbi:FAD-binding protein [Streptomyces sp. NPDC050421]|uniref:FAD-binding protein n=1 Tax=Streptomyces sp. NPDC050421 TaxID=3365613 RepID=UPI00379CBDEA